jgi:DNA repair protein RadC
VAAAHAAPRYRQSAGALGALPVVEPSTLSRPEDGRRPPGPRARLLAEGAGALGDAGCSGSCSTAAPGRARASRWRRVLLVARGLGGLERLDREACAGMGALWPRRAAAVRAALELGRRAAAAPLGAGEPVRDAAAVYGHFRGRLPQLEREVFFVLLLDGKNRLQAEVRISEGSLTAALVHPREVFVPAIRGAAAAIILVHNHPSGDPTPSAEDAAITQRLRQVGELVGIRVLDHVVVGRGRWASMAEEGRW